MATQLRFDVTALDQASRTFARMGQAVERFEKRLDRLDGKKVDAKVGVKTDEAEREIGAFATNARRKLEAALSSLPEIEIDANSTKAERRAADLRKQLAELTDKTIGVDIPADEAIAEAKRIQRELELLSRDRKATVQVRADAAKAAAELTAVYAAAEKVDGKRSTVKVDIDRSLSDSLIQVTRLASALGSLALPGAIVAAAPQIAAIGAAAATATGSLWLLPAAGTAGALAIGALAMGFRGFGDAVTEDDPKKAAEALAKLAPEAREAAAAARELAPAWGRVQQTVQQALFAGVSEDLKQLSGQYLPGTSRALETVATGFNRAVQSTAGFLELPSTVADLSRSLDLTGQSVSNASGALQPFTRALNDVVAVGAERLPALGSGFALATEKAAQFVAKARETGQLGQWIDSGIGALRDLGSIAGNVGGILGGIFTASRASGADFLGTLDEITGKLRELINSAQGQNALVAFFTDITSGVQAALPGVESLVLALGDVVQALGDAGVLEAAGSAFSAIAAQVAPLITGLSGLAPLLSGLLSVVGALAPVLTSGAIAFGAFWAAAKIVEGVQNITGRVQAFTSAIGNIGSSAGRGESVLRTLGQSLGAGGILGIGLAAAGIGLQLLADRQASARQAAAEHQAAVDNLAGSLDKVTGAATNATRELVAQELTSTKLSDGTTSLAAALQRAGISATDYVDATTGNQGKLDQLNATLFTQARATLEGSDAWRYARADFQNAGVSLDLATAAALGNVEAQQQMQGKLDATGKGWEGYQDKVRTAIGPLGEIGSMLGDQAGKFAQASAATQAAAGATQDYEKILGSLRDNGAFETIARGGQITDLAAKSMSALGESAARSAQAAGQAGAKYGDLENGAMKARQSMEASRESFIKSAEGALGSRQAAEQLANQLGLIPSAAETIFRTNATGVTAEMITLGGQIGRLPAGKDVTVRTLTAEAEANLTAMGFKIERLSDGTVKITANTDAASASLDAFTRGAADKKAEVQIGANKTPADASLGAVLAAIQGGAAEVTIGGNPMPANEALAFVMGAVGTAQGEVKIGAYSGPAQEVLQAYVAAVNSNSPFVQLGANRIPADQVLSALVATVGGTTATANLDANPALFQGKLLQGVAQADGSTGTITIDGNPTAANGKITSAVTFANGSKGSITIDGRPDPATGKVNAVVTYANGSTGRITLNPNDLVTPVINRLKEPTSSTHTITVRELREIVGPANIKTPMRAAGAFTSPAAYAGGGFRSLRRMSAYRAEMVPPNQPRIIGDRQWGNEAFIPVNRSRRSLELLARTAHAMGRDLVERGGSLASVTNTGAGSRNRLDRIRYGAVELGGARPSWPGSPIAEKVAASLPPAPAAAQGPDPAALLAGMRAAASSGASIAAAVGQRQAAAIGSLKRELAGLQGEMAGVAAAVREARPFTVLDQSGDPTETARRTALALRLR